MSRRLYKLVWSEGMCLAPHHFQAQSRFFEDSVHFVADCFSQFHYGYTSLDIDTDQLRGGCFLVRQATGAMADGMVFEISEQDDPRPFRAITEIFPHTGLPLMLYLALPSYREDQPNVSVAQSAGGGPRTRFSSASVEVADFNTGQDLRPVKLLNHNLRIATAGELTERDDSLPVARILRDGKGQYILDPGYAPPCLQVAASPRLEYIVERLIEILTEKSRNLTERRRNAPASEVRGDPRELVEFWLLHTVNSALPLLRSWRHAKSPHPAQLYLSLSQLAGALCTFGPDSQPMELPAYDHLALGDCFAAIDEHIQRHLELGLPTNCLTIPLQRTRNLYFQGAVGDPRCFEKSRWVLAIRASVPESYLISQVPSLVKISARDWIERVVRSAVSGAPLLHMPVPPASVPAHFGTVFFAVDQGHRLFDPIRSSRDIGIYVPGELANPEVELFVVLGETRV
jgi:type VI secretion system protein ImpJ